MSIGKKASLTPEMCLVFSCQVSHKNVFFVVWRLQYGPSETGPALRGCGFFSHGTFSELKSELLREPVLSSERHGSIIQ